jgi:dTDP-4-amino-4,6-dideoxygalactose transaminase
MKEKLLVGRPNIGNRDALIARIDSILDSRWLTNNGTMVQEFESRISEYVGVKHAVAVNNATIGLEIAIKALGLSGEVIVPSYTFIATAHALTWLGLTPVFADIDPATHNLDPVSVEAAASPRTSGIIGVHLWGRPCDTDALAAIAERRGIALMYDAAHAFGCSHNGTMIGNFGACEVFSFHATKFLNSFEGGAIVSNDDKLAERLRLMRNFGFAGPDNVVSEGTNGKMPEVCAAMGLTSLDAIDEIIAVNRRNYHAYQAGLVDVPGVELIEYNESERNNFQYMVAEALDREHRDRIVEALHAQGVMARKYFWPGIHKMGAYRGKNLTAGVRLPNTDKVAERVFVLPTGQSVNQAGVLSVAHVIGDVS